MNKKILLALPICFLLASCAPPSDIIIDDEVEAVEDGATEISMWMMDFEEWENRINVGQRKAFNKNLEDGIQVKQTYIDSNNFDDLIRSAYSSHNVPDIYMVSYGNLYKEISTGRAIDLTSYFSNEIWSDLTDTATEGVKYNDKYYGFPIVMEPSTVLAYRKDLLKQYVSGFNEETDIPTKWDDLLALCKSIKTGIKSSGKKGINAFSVPTGVALAWGSWGMQYAASGGLAVTDDWSTSRVNGAGKEGYSKLASVFGELCSNGYVPLAAGNYTEASFDLCDGKSVMTTCGSWSVASIINNYPEMVENVGFAVMPTIDGNQDTVTATNGGWVYVISSECKNVEKAVEVIKFLTAEDTAQTVDYFQKAHYSKASPRKSVQAILDESYKKQDVVPTEWIDVINYVAERAVLEPIYDWDISVAVEGLFEEVAMDPSALNASMKKCDDAITKIIVDRGLAGKNPRLK
jgi:multiple sugar transport system substrate-binding protein